MIRPFYQRLSLIVVVLFTCVTSQAQYLNIPATGVANSPINFPNTSGLSQFSNNYFYTNSDNFSIANNPLSNFITYGFPSNLLQTPAFSDLAFNGTNYYLFTTNYNGGIIRWDFGPNIMSTPIALNLGITGLQQIEGIVIRKEGTNWYGFICSNGAGQRLTRIDFGTNLNNPTPATTNLGVLNLSWPHELTIFEDNGNWYGFAANRNTTVVRLDFGTSLSNTPTTFSFTNPNIVSPCNLRVIKDQGDWYLFSVNLFNGDIVRTDLGASLGNNTPTYINLGEPNPALGIARGFSILKDCNGIRGLLSDESSNIFNLSFAGDSVTGALSGTLTSSIPFNSGTINDFTPFWLNDTLFMFVTNPFTNYVGRIQINPTTTPGYQSSTDFSPTFNYATAGNHDISHLINIGSNGMRYQCEQINIASMATVIRTRCPGDTIMLSNNTVISIPGTYTDTLLDINNQDSLISVVFNHYPVYSNTNNVNICQGQSYTLPSTTVVNTAGTYIDTLNTVNGCDSIITTVLVVNPTYQATINDTICGNVTYQLPSGLVVNTTGTYTSIFTTADGCDSTFITNLLVHPTYQISIYDTICQGSNYTLPDASIVSSSGVYITPFQTVQNCDSIITTYLEVSPNYTINESINLCDQSSYQLPSGSSVTSSGIYTSLIPTSAGCDSTIISQVTFGTTSTTTQDAVFCSNDAFVLPNNSLATVAGQYTTILKSAEGCDSTIISNLETIDPPIVDLGADVTICNNESITLDVRVTNATYAWNDLYKSGIRKITEAGNYVVQVTVAPCAPVIDEITISGCNCKVFIPNAFSPNGDGNNDIFRPVMNCNVVPDSYFFQVYNRWGERVFESRIPRSGWEGTYYGELQPNGTYFYILKFKIAESEVEKKYQGDVNLIK